MAMGGRVSVVTLDLPSTSKFGNSFHYKYVGAVLKAVDFPWEEKFGCGSPPGLDIFPSGLPSTSKFGHNFLPESVDEVLNAVVLL